MIFSFSNTDTMPFAGILIGIAKIVCFFLPVLVAKSCTSLALISSSLLSIYGNTTLVQSKPAFAAVRHERNDRESWILLKTLPCEPAMSPPGAVISCMQTYADFLPTMVRMRRLASFLVFAGRGFIDANLFASMLEAVNSISLPTYS